MENNNQDLLRFRQAMAGKWKNMDKIFRDIDKSGDGKIDVQEFSICCKRLKLGWSEFQVTHFVEYHMQFS